MDSIIYDYLKNNKNDIIEDLDHDDYDFENDNQIFLNCLLILSINKIKIDYYTLLDYCSNIIKNRNIYRDDVEDIYYGLNNNQFNILYKIIKSLNVFEDKGNNNDNHYDIQTIIDQHSNSSSSSSSSSSSKFDNSILIIIKNNLKFQQKRNKIEIIKKKKRNSAENDDYNYLLFKKVWGNLIIRNEIKFHIRLFDLNKNHTNFTVKELRNYKYRNYLNSIEIYGGRYEDEEDEEDEYDGCEEDNIFAIEHCKLISPSVKNLELYNFTLFKEKSIPSTITSLVIYGKMNQKLTKDIFSDSIIGSDNITELYIRSPSFNQSLGTCSNGSDGQQQQQQSWLPRNLTNLSITGDSFNQTIYPGHLPNSLTSLILDHEFKGRILPNSIPKSVTTLDYTFESNYNSSKLISFRKTIIPSSITKLRFNNDFNQNIEKGDIPHNVTSLAFGWSFNSKIEAGSLPNSLQSLTFGNDYNQAISSSEEEGGGGDIHSFLPQSITKLHFGIGFKQSIDNNIFKLLPNLNNLKLGSCDCESIPNSVKTLNLGMYGNSNLITNSLTSLSYNIKNNIFKHPFTFPNSITSLRLDGSVNQTNIPKQLPINLKTITLDMTNDNNDDLSLIDWPKSLEKIYILYGSYHFFNNSPIDFLLKYIKKIN